MTRPARFVGRVARLLALASMALLAACASDPARVPMGIGRAEALQRLGQPTATYPLPGGGERLQYSRAPAGFEVNNVDLDREGRVVGTRQELSDALFDRTIRPGEWREADVLRTYGRPFERARVSSFDGQVWSWHYRSMNHPRFLYIYIDPRGVVERYHTADDASVDNVRD